MKLFDIFKKKPSSAKATEGKKEEIKPAVKKPKKKVPGEAWRILQSPHVTEKATGLGKEDKYVFNIKRGANKIETKKAIEGLYGVDVVDVKTINIPRKKRRLGRQTGWKKGYKKAIVKIKKGQKIEIMPR